MKYILSENESERYARQIMPGGWGMDGQERLKNSEVFIAGAGGLGSPVSLYLAAAGVGKIRICDSDTIELSNLNRQILHDTASIGTAKTVSAWKRITSLNPEIEVDCIQDRINETNAGDIIGTPSIMVDCLDNFPTRRVLNTYSVKTGIPLVHGGISGLSGQISFFHPPETACLACVFPETPDERPIPVIGATAGVIGSLQAVEVLKYLTGSGDQCAGKLLIFDGPLITFLEVPISKAPNCPVCGENP